MILPRRSKLSGVNDMANKIIIDESKCTNCGLCARVCFVNYEPFDGRMGTGDAPVLCAACGHCVAVCPTGAIRHPGVSNSDCDPLDEASRPNYEQFMGFLKMRRSRREFRDAEIPRDVIQKLLLAAAQAPNGCNRQNVCYTVITDRKVIKQMTDKITEQTAKLCRLLDKPIGRAIFKLLYPRTYRELEFFLPLMGQISDGRYSELDLVAYDAPCCILVHTTRDDICGAEDSVFAAANVQYAAETLGLGTCCVGFITGPVNADKGLRTLVGLPADHKVQTSLIVGYPEFRYTRSAPKHEPRVTYVDRDNDGVRVTSG